MRVRILPLLLVVLVSVPPAHAQSTFDVIAYHDVRDNVVEGVDRDPYAISTHNLIEHFEWLRLNGYHVVSVEDVLRARRNATPLPPRSVLLTFDDGLESMYTRVFPLLKLFGYPAVASIVTAWIESDAEVVQGGQMRGSSGFLSWAQIREMQTSGLVEIASHSHDLHRGIEANPQGNLEPAAVTRRFTTNGYETDEAYGARVAADLATSARLLEQHAGRAPRTLAWPFGAYNTELLEAAAACGFELMLTLDDEERADLDHLDAVARHVFRGNPGVATLGAALLYAPGGRTLRAAQVDLDYVYDPDAAQQERNLGLLLDRIKALEISHVFLQAFADPDGDGGADALYFPNRHLPVRADLFNRVAWQLKTRANVLVYAWLPVLSFVGTEIDPAWRVLEEGPADPIPDPASEPRLSPFVPQARALIADVYADLGRYANFDGLLFHDDARLSEIEDLNPAALAVARRSLGAGFSPEQAARDPALAARWAAIKSRALLDLTAELTATVRRYRPAIKTARNLFASSLLDAQGFVYLSQRLPDYLAAYDYTALMAMPGLEGRDDATTFYRRLVDRVAAVPNGLARTIFELQTIDWRTEAPIDGQELTRTMRWLQSQGVKHLAYYPDDFLSNAPPLDALRAGMSLAEQPSGAGP